MTDSIVYTVGHSTRPLEQFVMVLRSFDVSAVIDIRTIPRSRTNPQYNLETLPGELSHFGIEHFQIAELGGLRKKSRTIPEETNAYWVNRSFHNYADYALTQEFSYGLQRLIDISKTKRCAIMCAEAVWWRCHRRIVADYLLTRHVEVIHILDAQKAASAVLTPAAVLISGSCLSYPRLR